MEKRRITGLLVAIGLALVGLLAIQVKWVRDTKLLRQSQYHRSIDNALHAVSDRMERIERMQVLQGHKVGKRLLQKLDEHRDNEVKRLGVRDGTGVIVEKDGSTEVPSGMEERVTNETPVQQTSGEDQEELITDMVRGILASELARDIQERIDPHLLDSLLKEEMTANGIFDTVHFAVAAENGEPVHLSQVDRSAMPVRADTPFRERLFKHDHSGPEYFLLVDIPGEHAAIWRGLWPLLLISVVLMAIIIAGFGFTIRTIVRQKRIGEIRTDLVNNLTHELKTPISTIGLACEALSDPSMPKTEEQTRTFVGMIRDENKRLGSLVENVLQSAVLEGGHMVLKRVDLDIHTVVGEVVRSSSMLVERRNGRIDTELNAEIHHVNGDRTHLTNVLYNLIENAVKYAEQEPRIRIATISNDVGITISITDNGIGISPSEQTKVFDRLYRVPTGNIHNAKGFGLGLSYVRTVVERHSGRIKLESIPGQGSTFRIYIPFEHVNSPKIVGGRG